MSEAIAFDTHRYVKRLMEGGFDERQAETLAEEQIAFLNANLATKSDIAKIEAGIESLRRPGARHAGSGVLKTSCAAREDGLRCARPFYLLFCC